METLVLPLGKHVLPNPEWRPAPEKTGVAPTSAPMPFPSQTSKEAAKE